MRLATLLVLCVFCTSASAAEKPDDPRCIPQPQKTVAAAVAVFPGVIAPGLGHLAGGEPRTGTRLLLVGAISLGALGLSFPFIYFSGAARDYIGPPTAVAAMSVGTLLGMAFADLVGVLSPGGFGHAPRGAPRLEVGAGYRHVVDPTQDHGPFALVDASLRRGRLSASPSLWLALGDDNLRLRVPVRVALFASEHDASHLSLETALTFHRFGDEGFSTTIGELSAQGRFDLARLDPRLSGTFHELGAGYAAGQVRYHDFDGDFTDLLLARFAFGLYVGHDRGGAGEIALEYDHRHDDFAAGLKMPGLGSGPAGHFGLRFLWVAPSGWGVRADVTAGSAWVTGVSLIYRRGGVR